MKRPILCLQPQQSVTGVLISGYTCFYKHHIGLFLFQSLPDAADNLNR